MAGFKRGKKKKDQPEYRLDFVSPFSLDACVGQLLDFPGAGEWYPIKIRVKVTRLSEKAYHFVVYKTYFDDPTLYRRGTRRGSLVAYFQVQAEGELIERADETTHVIGRVFISRHTAIVNGLMAVSMGALAVVVFLYPTIPVPVKVFLIFGCFSIFGSGLLGIFSVGRERFVPVLKDHVTRVLGR